MSFLLILATSILFVLAVKNYRKCRAAELAGLAESRTCPAHPNGTHLACGGCHAVRVAHEHRIEVTR